MAKMWLIGGLVGVVALAVGAIVSALVAGRGGVGLLPADSPEGVVQRYLRALEKEEYREAHGYLTSDLQRRCPLGDFTTERYWRDTRDEHVTLEKTQVSDGEAIVVARVTVFEPDVPFGPSEYSYDETYHLKLEAGQWRLTGPYWRCPWY